MEINICLAIIYRPPAVISTLVNKLEGKEDGPAPLLLLSFLSSRYGHRLPQWPIRQPHGLPSICQSSPQSFAGPSHQPVGSPFFARGSLSPNRRLIHLSRPHPSPNIHSPFPPSRSFLLPPLNINIGSPSQRQFPLLVPTSPSRPPPQGALIPPSPYQLRVVSCLCPSSKGFWVAVVACVEWPSSCCTRWSFPLQPVLPATRLHPRSFCLSPALYWEVSSDVFSYVTPSSGLPIKSPCQNT